MKYNYIAKTPTGEVTKGTVEASDINQARSQLVEKEVFVTSITAAPAKSMSFLPFFSKVKVKEKVVFTEQLAVMVKAGFPITRALTTIRRQTKNKNFQEIISKVEQSVRGGSALSEALLVHKETFSELYCEVVAAGEQSGNLDKVLRRLADDMEKSYQLSGKVRSALTYPIFVLVVMLLIVVAMLIFVVPQLKNLFSDMNIALPWTTRILISLSNFFVSFWWLFLLLIIGSVWGFRAYYKTEGGRVAIDRLKLKTPIIGGILRKIYLASFSRTLDTLISAGIPILDVFKTLSKTVGNEIYSKSILEARNKIEGGSTISKALIEDVNFPPLLTQLIEVGEETGDINSTLKTASDFFENEVDTTTRGLSSLIEPILIVVLGAGALFIILSIIMPIYNLVNVIQ